MNKKTLFLAAFLLLDSLMIFAGEDSQGGMVIGIAPEIKGFSPSNVSLGGSLMFALDINSHFATGLKTGFFHDLDEVGSLELQGFFRYYLPWLHWPTSLSGPFLQAEAGGVILFYEGEKFPAFSGGLAAGWRFLFKQKSNAGYNWYIEPSMRTGYPFIWGVGLTFGIRIKKQVTINEQTVIRNEVLVEERKEEPVVEVKIAETIEKAKEPEIIIEEIRVEEEGAFLFDGNEYRLPNTFIYFHGNFTDFRGLSREMLENNERSFEFLEKILKQRYDYILVIEGHSNPTTAEGRARAREESVLKQISEERARMVLMELSSRGIDRNRLFYIGVGISKLMVPYNDRDNLWKNRRVEFILMKDKKRN